MTDLGPCLCGECACPNLATEDGGLCIDCTLGDLSDGEEYE